MLQVDSDVDFILVVLSTNCWHLKKILPNRNHTRRLVLIWY